MEGCKGQKFSFVKYLEIKCDNFADHSDWKNNTYSSYPGGYDFSVDYNNGKVLLRISPDFSTLNLTLFIHEEKE
jgi:hypothetical protein